MRAGGLRRSADLTDVENTLGGFLGVVFFQVMLQQDARYRDLGDQTARSSVIWIKLLMMI